MTEENRLQQIERETRERTAKRAEQRRERDAFYQAAQARRDAIARGDISPALPAGLPRLAEVIGQSTRDARQQLEQRVAEQAAGPHAWRGQGLHLPKTHPDYKTKEQLVRGDVVQQ